jgi:glucokinase
VHSMLAADVGGTHARFGLIELHGGARPQLSNRLDLEAEQFPGFPAALHAYIEHSGLASLPRAAAIAAAGPVTRGRVNLTNRNWSISESELRQLGFADVILINDFAALAHSVETLEPRDLLNIGPDLEGAVDSPVSIMGAGTGFGVSCLVRHGKLVIPLVTEGGHIGFAPTDGQQVETLRALQRQFGRVSVERILSGAGLQNLYRIQQEAAGRSVEMLSAAELTTRAMAGESDCRNTLTLFCSVYGSVAGDIALAHGARGGVIIAGGIAQKIQTFLIESPFRQQFENKGRLSDYVRAIPTRLLIDPDAALRGAARAGIKAWT